MCDYYDDPYETGTHRRVDVTDNEWCDDEYYGYHYPVHYLDDRGVYNNGYGEHLGTAYGDNGVKPGVLHKMVQDHYGDFFHGLSPGYDWVEEHNRRSEVPAGLCCASGGSASVAILRLPCTAFFVLRHCFTFSS